MSNQLKYRLMKVLKGKMVHFRIVNSVFQFALILFLLFSCDAMGQKDNDIKKIVAKVIDVDSKGVFDKDFAMKVSSLERHYYYAILHFKVVTYNSDTLTIAYVFDTKRQLKEATHNFSIVKDSVYQFDLYNLKPCSSDYPLLIGCLYKDEKSRSIYVPNKNSFVKKSYTDIWQILDFTPISHVLWKELLASGR
jgi:hypothetical protein